MTNATSRTLFVVLLSLVAGFHSARAEKPEPVRSKQAGTDHWSLRTVVSPQVPLVKNKNWPRNAIDFFVLKKLEDAGLAPSPEADRATLIRRLSFDLTGLPPAPEDIDAFLRDKSPRAYEQLVERLLASPHYGERWARHWLDVVRYTESQGFEYDHMRPNAWHYRDYVISSFNADKPYNQFVKEQIAGDAMEPVTPERIIATSLLVCGAWDQAGNSQANATQRAITREEEMEDLISVVAQTFLGLTINCARCHSHKFDPIPQEDYYRIKAVFEGVRHGERVIATQEEIKTHEDKLAALKTRIADNEKQVGQMETEARRRVLDKRKQSRSSEPLAPTPIARWKFDSGAEDSIGSLHGELHGNARISEGRLVLDGENAFVRTAPLARNISEKTLEVWVALSNLDQRGGGALSLETGEGRVFDGIVFGERQPRKWSAGSNNFERTRDLEAPEESSPPNAIIHIAVVYRADNSIAVYRNGELYGRPYTPDKPLQTYEANEAYVLFGKRHTGGGKPFLAAEIEQASLYDCALSSEEVKASLAASGLYVSPQETLAALASEEQKQRENLIHQIDRARETLKAIPPLPLSYAGARKQPEPTRLLKRGDVKSPGDAMVPGALSAISEPKADFGLAVDALEAERRLKLAEWITNARNPLTARVMANRLWHYHFGAGIVATPNDLGASGAKPSHLELLDWLAATLVERGWSIKALHRLIVCSATYRQAATLNPAAERIDAENQFLWRFTPRRLEAEALRDAMLAVSGQINLAQGGPSFRSFDTKSFNATFYFPEDKIGSGFNRRTIYRMNVNSGKDPLLDAFDCPDPATKTPRRGVTTTPLQALSLMNNSFVQRQAADLAERVLKETDGSIADAIRRAYRYAFGRAPSSDEATGATVVAEETSLQNVCWALLNATEFIYVK